MASLINAKLQSIRNQAITHAQPLFASRRNVLTTLLATTLSLPLLYLTWTDYQSWLTVGRGGLPQNPIGYLIAILLRPLKASRFDTSFIDKPNVLKKSGKAGEKAYLNQEDVPVRTGERPEVGGWILPQRQLDQKAEGLFKPVSFQHSFKNYVLNWACLTCAAIPNIDHILGVRKARQVDSLNLSPRTYRSSSIHQLLCSEASGSIWNQERDCASA